MTPTFRIAAYALLLTSLSPLGGGAQDTGSPFRVAVDLNRDRIFGDLFRKLEAFA